MNVAQGHRGPDDAGYYLTPAGEVGLAHTRLSIIDLSAGGHQPMLDEESKVAIAFNGEIYNYRELRSDLQARGRHFRTQTDTEVILQLYLQEGERGFERLNGIFALAIWDPRGDKLLLVRDSFGVKPLYYATVPQGVLFASELKALICAREVPLDLDHQTVLSHLTYLFAAGQGTMLSAVKKLEPATILEVRQGKITHCASFYRVPPFTGRPMSERVAVSELNESLKTAVERQMVADVPVGAFLSGGLDSSCIAYFAREFCGARRLQCFTIALADDNFVREGFADDLPYARKAAKHLGVDLHEVRAGPEMAYDLERMVYYLDEPQADLAPIHVLAISRLARERGIKVLLSGTGGDDLFAGYRRHFAIRNERRWAFLPSFARRILSTCANTLPSRRSAALRRIKKAFKYAYLNQDERIESYFWWTPPATALGLLSADLRAANGHFLKSRPLSRTLDELDSGESPLGRALQLDVRHFLADHNLNYTDKMGMANGVEIRVPFLDPDLVDLASCIPDSLKQRGHHSKWILKRAMEGRLPNDIIYRPKTGFGAPLHSWLRGPLKTLLADTLSVTALKRRGLFDPDAVLGLIRADQARTFEESQTLLAVLCAEIWCRTFIDGAQNMRANADLLTAAM
jgi:asparagine synthase (glutamine-hydrolysing)